MVPSNNICLEEYLRHYGVNHHHYLGTSNVKNFIFLDVQQSKFCKTFHLHSVAITCHIESEVEITEELHDKDQPRNKDGYAIKKGQDVTNPPPTPRQAPEHYCTILPYYYHILFVYLRSRSCDGVSASRWLNHLTKQSFDLTCSPSVDRKWYNKICVMCVHVLSSLTQ